MYNYKYKKIKLVEKLCHKYLETKVFLMHGTEFYVSALWLEGKKERAQKMNLHIPKRILWILIES